MGGPNTEARSNTEHDLPMYLQTSSLTQHTYLLSCYLRLFVLTFTHTNLRTYRRIKHEACSIAPADDAAGVAVRDVLTFEVRRPPARTE